MDPPQNLLEQYLCALLWLGVEAEVYLALSSGGASQKQTQCTRNGDRGSSQLGADVQGTDCEVLPEFRELGYLSGRKEVGRGFLKMDFRWSLKRGVLCVCIGRRLRE